MSNPLTLSNQPMSDPANIRFSIFRTIAAAAKDWDAAAPAHDLFLQRQYLQILEANPPVGMRFAYVVFYRNEQPIGVSYCQIKAFKGDDNIQEIEQTAERDPCFFTNLASWLKRWIAGRVTGNILISGNMLLTGEHGFYFDYQQITQEAAAVQLEASHQAVLLELEREGDKVPVILLKDIDPAEKILRETAVADGYVEFEIQPNMVLDLRWAKFEDYLAAMSTRYRTRAKRAFKKLDGIEKRELAVADIERELPRMYALYRDIAKNAGFNMVDLNEHYLPALKRDFSAHFRAFGYYLEGKMVAYFTVICNGHEMEAHFIGYEKSLNHDYQIYLNILYDIVRLGIEANCKRVVFARTALEIKSSVGAVPTELFCYLRHQNGVVNKFTGHLLDYLKPVEVWKQRHPFKEGSEDSTD